jgi:MFS family permease
MFRNANLANFMSSAGLVGALFLLPLFLQQLRGLSATQSGLTTFPQALGTVAMSQISTRLYPKIGPRRMMFVGGLGTAILTVGFLFINLETSLWWIRGIMFTRGIFFSLSLVPIQAATYSTISQQDQGRASSLFNTNRQVASSVGVAILATVLAQSLSTQTRGATTPQAIANGALTAFHYAFAVAVVLALLAALFALFIHDEDAKASMEPLAKRASPVPEEAAAVP